jgi:hypothetical protein
MADDQLSSPIQLIIGALTLTRLRGVISSLSHYANSLVFTLFKLKFKLEKIYKSSLLDLSLPHGSNFVIQFKANLGQIIFILFQLKEIKGLPWVTLL